MILYLLQIYKMHYIDPVGFKKIKGDKKMGDFKHRIYGLLTATGLGPGRWHGCTCPSELSCQANTADRAACSGRGW